jgi:tetratricopeptide (TPR) repeat protein
MSDAGKFYKLLNSGNTLEVSRLARQTQQVESHAGNSGKSSLAINAILFFPESGDPQGRLPEERARQLDLLADAPDPLRAVLLYNLGCIALYEDDILAAKLRFGEAARLSPGHHPSLHNLAHAHELMADFEDARNELERALNVNPGCALTRINLATVYFSMGEGEQGLATLREVAAAEPENMGAALHLCRGLLDFGGQDGAREVRTVLEQRPGWRQYPELMACGAFACFLTEAWEEAQALFQDLLEQDQDSAFARMGMIKVLAAREDFEQLLPHLERYQQSHPNPSLGHIIEKIRET